MTSPPIPTKDELLRGLEESRDDLAVTVRELPEAEWTAGRYENGWNARQILAHVASIEWTYPRLAELAKQAAAAPKPANDAPPPQITAQGGIDSYNARQVEKREGASVQELLDEFLKNRAATIEAVRNTPEELLAVELKSAGGVTGPLGRVWQAVTVGHIRQHARDIRGES